MVYYKVDIRAFQWKYKGSSLHGYWKSYLGISTRLKYGWYQALDAIVGIIFGILYPYIGML